ncbi:glycoside hydrolase family 71 protein [Auriscalpium vulgare]|uniref:Glycoside hydrolase family 71 protein n=1 Tax=Auriscalpium vulgare TaxID=40419 RepID=A0ACB8RYX0_9AGAM|nr:glycoside hydrolase family 71 protein [Auriscalpium vulgare]
MDRSDAFALNVGREDWQLDRVADCYAAALDTRSEMKLFLSFDMTSIPAGEASDIELIKSYVRLFGHHPNQFRYEGKVFISTFAGDQSTFGSASLDKAWALVKTHLEDIAPIHLVPAFFMDPASYPSTSSIDGIFHWNGGWPLHLTRSSPCEEIQFPKLDSDQHHLRHLDGRTYMAAVSPWFFTHYGPDSWNKNWVYRGDDWLFVRRWEQVLAFRNHIDIVQVISWNDYGESHYLGPIKGAQPNSQAWVDGFSHEPWLRLNAYYARAFKEGRLPPIDEDKIFVWARPHPKAASATDPVPRPENWELTEDVMWVVVFATAPAVVWLWSAEDKRQRFEVGAGVAKLAWRLEPGGGMHADVVRAGHVVARCHPAGFQFDANPRLYNFNAYVAASE